MRDVMVTGIGPKRVDGVVTGVPAIHCLVRRKRPLAELPRAARIPRALDGVPTDVVDCSCRALGGPIEAPVPQLLPPTGCGYGMPLLTESGAWGTAACAGTLADGRPVLITSAHVVDLDESVYDGGSDPPLRLGRCVGRLPTASRSELYGQRGSAAAGQHLVDVAVLVLDPEISIVGQPGALAAPLQFGLAEADTARIDAWLFASTPLFAWGAASRTWRRGAVAFYWPRRTEDDLYGLCLIEQEPLSEPGDSGSLWLAYLGGQLRPVGLHWGLSTDQRSLMSFVTDGIAAARQLGVGTLSA
jgi:hypothetical protein